MEAVEAMEAMEEGCVVVINVDAVDADAMDAVDAACGRLGVCVSAAASVWWKDRDCSLASEPVGAAGRAHRAMAAPEHGRQFGRTIAGEKIESRRAGAGV